ncbi:MAG: hypothetical protein HY399_02535, partial [Elusimicrobia bacterium]|nr:hypothetical protein [Elusimicrobiota bacterium]
ERRSNLEKTLFIVSAKSGTTLETLSFFEYFYEKLKKIKGNKAGEHFVAITDPGTPLETLARERSFRKTFLNPEDIGGRYSALSYFGLVPAALMGIQVERLLDQADRMAEACRHPSPEQNPGLWLGAHLTAWAQAGRDKVTFILSPTLTAFGYWVEQLLAESTGKEDRGLVPIESERLGTPDEYGEDRLFVYIRFHPTPDQRQEKSIRLLEEQGHPVIRLNLESLSDLSAEFFRWEVATVVAGALLQMDAFDEPNVQESKDLTKTLLDRFIQSGKLPEPPSIPEENMEESLLNHLRHLKQGSYLSLLAYLPRISSVHRSLQEIRFQLQRMKCATTLGYGPRYLHSTGQLHKGGKNEGIFILLVGRDQEDIPIPGQPYSFGTLKKAQAWGDFQALKNKGRKVISLDLDYKAEAILNRMVRFLQQASFEEAKEC